MWIWWIRIRIRIRNTEKKTFNLPIRHKTVYSRNMSHRICTVRIFSIHNTQDPPTLIPLLGKKTKEQKTKAAAENQRNAQLCIAEA
jgi:hypothetical protein